jgi:lipid-binding SYLF domain-containing protein
MSYTRRAMVLGTGAAALALPLLTPSAAVAAKSTDIDQRANAALHELYHDSVLARDLSKTAKGILVFPRIHKAGFIVGAAYGEGVLHKNGRAAGYYSSFAASYGFQAGVQWFGYALFFTTDDSLRYLDKSDGWEVGSGPSIVVVDKGAATKHSSTTLTQDVYAFIFNQRGLMAGLGLEGSKITKLDI